MLPRGIEAAFRGPLLALLGNDAGGVRPVAQGDVDHLLRCRHLEVERHLEFAHQPVDVGIDDVASIFAQMGGNAVGAGRLGDTCRAQRIGQMPAAGITHGGDVIDVDAETQGIGRSHTHLSRRENKEAVNCGRVRRR